MGLLFNPALPTKAISFRGSSPAQLRGAGE